MRTKGYHLQPNQAIVQDVFKYDLDFSNTFLHFTLNDPIDKFSNSKGIMSLIRCSRFAKEFNPILVLLCLKILKLLC